MIGVLQLDRLVGNKIGYKMLDKGNSKIINNFERLNNKKESEYNCRVVTTIIILTLLN